MDWQQLVALGIVALTAAFMLWRRFRPRQFQLRQDSPCGCSGAQPRVPRETITFHARKGERPEVIVRMK